MINGFGRLLIEASTSAQSDLFMINDKSLLVDKKRRKLFYHLAYQLVYTIGRGRKDSELAILFLTGCLLQCTKGDYYKLRHLIYYIYSTKDLEVIIGIEDMTRLITFIDTSCVVHSNMKSHTSSTISFRTGVYTSESKK